MMRSLSLFALAFTADFPPSALKFHQRTHRVRLKNLNTSDKKSSHKIKYKKIQRVHFDVLSESLMHLPLRLIFQEHIMMCDY